MVNGGSGGNKFTITNTPNGVGNPTTTLNSGVGADTVTVQATDGPLKIDGQNDADTVTIGNAGSVQGIKGVVSIANTRGLTALEVDDSADAAARVATISATAITGLAPAAINYVANDLNALTVNGGAGGNTFTVANTPGGAGVPTTTLNSGTGADDVNVEATTGPLTVEGQNGADTVTIGDAGSVQQIAAPVTVSNQNNFTELEVDDSADAGARAATVGAASITGLAPAPINYVANDLSALTIDGGTAGNAFTVTNTPNGAGTPTTTLNSGTGADRVTVQATDGPLDINGQRGADTVNIGNAGNAQGIMGDVSVSNTASRTALTVDDSADAAAQTATLTAAALTGLTPGDIKFQQLDLSSLTIKGGTGGNNFTIANTPNNGLPLVTQLNSGTGADTITVQATTGASTSRARTAQTPSRSATRGMSGPLTASSTCGTRAASRR